MSGAGAANHARSFGQSDGRSTGVGEALRSLRKQLQSLVKIYAERIYFALDCGQSSEDGSIVGGSGGFDLLPHPVDQRAVLRWCFKEGHGSSLDQWSRKQSITRELFAGQKVGAVIDASQHHIYEQPFFELAKGVFRHRRKTNADPSRPVTPDNFTGRLNARAGGCKIETQIHVALNLQRKRSLNRHAFFTDVDDLTEIEDLAI